jgi:DNA (cytosine-5)-methyltransferase 1
MNNILRVGTDCSGIEAPIQALLQLKIPFRHVFSSDIDKYCIQSIKANYEPEIIFGDKEGSFPDGDITKRNIKDVPDIDLYVCGFPCQPFSIAGERKGFEDKRGNVFFSCLEVIETKQPKYFILENVKGLKSHDKGNTWKVIWKYILGLEKYGYIVKWKILNTRDYGIPQNRERVFIVGIKDEEFEFPLPKKMKKLESFIDNTYNEINNISNTLKNTLERCHKNSIFVDRGQFSSTYPNADKWTPTITTSNNLWCIPKMRYATHKERLKLQGFPIKFKKVVSKTQFNKQIGNSMSVNVLKCLYKDSFDSFYKY